MKLWFDFEKNFPLDYIWCSKLFILKGYVLGNWDSISEINLCYGDKGVVESDSVRFLKWLDDTSKQDKRWSKHPWRFSFHSMTDVQREELETIINRHNWKIVEEDV